MSWLQKLCMGCLLLLPIGLQASSTAASDQPPWFTGPLLAPTAFVLKPGTGNVEPYLFWGVIQGRYDDDWKAHSRPDLWVMNTQYTFRIGLIDKIDVAGFIQSSLQSSRGITNGSFGDLSFGFDAQLFEFGPENETSLGKLGIRELFPTGRFERLDAFNLGTDIGGQGAYVTTVSLTFSKQWKIREPHFYRGRWHFTISYPTRVKVHGLSTYGGDGSTRGRVNPGIVLTFLTSGEYTLTEKWVLACDFQATYGAKTHFSGRTHLPVISPSSLQFSLAPAIEYNWDGSLGVIVGAWFTLAGKNTPQFITSVAAINYNF